MGGRGGKGEREVGKYPRKHFLSFYPPFSSQGAGVIRHPTKGRRGACVYRAMGHRVPDDGRNGGVKNEEEKSDGRERERV